ncbi:MAG: hypothetical protein ACRDKL_02790 [Solirubrobacteraceae bacterium]
MSFSTGGAQVWESLDQQARERVLRVLAAVIGQIVADAEQAGERR